MGARKSKTRLLNRAMIESSMRKLSGEATRVLFFHLFGHRGQNTKPAPRLVKLGEPVQKRYPEGERYKATVVKWVSRSILTPGGRPLSAIERTSSAIRLIQGRTRLELLATLNSSLKSSHGVERDTHASEGLLILVSTCHIIIRYNAV